MECNIDRDGRRLRRNLGFFCTLVSALLITASVIWINVTVAIIAVVVAFAAVLCFWQAQKGYCGLRGMGIKTKM